MSLNTRVLLALIAGIGIGLLLGLAPGPASSAIVAVVEPFGTLFVNAIRMTVVPLVVAALIAAVGASGQASSIAKVGGRGLVVFFVLLTLSGIAGALIAPPVFSRLHIDAAGIAALRAQASDAGVQTGVVSAGGWLMSLVPSNPVAAATDGAMLPLIVFALALGLAVRSAPDEPREKFLLVVRAIADSMLVLVRWILFTAPIGVFALALPLVARLGLSAVGALAAYIVTVSLGAALFVVLVVYTAAVFAGRLPFRRFARAAAPAQMVAISSRSSLAALPALIEAARDRLGYPPEIAGFFIPLATALFRVAAPLSLTVGTVFIARLYGVTLAPLQLATVVVLSVITSLSVPGIPGGSILVAAPVLASVGLPLAGLGILLGADTLPDIVRTTANVTGQMAAAVIVARDPSP